jgi:hypothetical protein
VLEAMRHFSNSSTWHKFQILPMTIYGKIFHGVTINLVRIQRQSDALCLFLCSGLLGGANQATEHSQEAPGNPKRPGNSLEAAGAAKNDPEGG